MSASIKDKIHSVLYVLLNQNVDEPHKERVRKLAQISRGSFPSAISRIVKKEGTIENGKEPGTIKLTAMGKDLAAGITLAGDLASTNAEIQENLKKTLKGMALKIFEYLSDGEEKEKEDVMSAVNCTKKSTFGPIMSRDLRAKGIVEYPNRTTVKLSKEMCFPFDE